MFIFWYSNNNTKAPLFFHPFTGCDQTSFFAKCRKKSAWSTWRNFDEVTETFVKLSSSPIIKAVTDAIPVVERFDVLMYDRTSNCLDINSCSSDLFVKKGRAIEALPPTFATILPLHKKSYFPSPGMSWKVQKYQEIINFLSTF